MSFQLNFPPMTPGDDLHMAAGQENSLSDGQKVRTRAGVPLVSNACDFCKKRKIKCDGGVPCFQCMKRNLHCEYHVKPVKRTTKLDAAVIQLVENENFTTNQSQNLNKSPQSNMPTSETSQLIQSPSAPNKVEELKIELEVQKRLVEYWRQQFVNASNGLITSEGVTTRKPSSALKPSCFCQIRQQRQEKLSMPSFQLLSLSSLTTSSTTILTYLSCSGIDYWTLLQKTFWPRSAMIR